VCSCVPSLFVCVLVVRVGDVANTHTQLPRPCEHIQLVVGIIPKTFKNSDRPNRQTVCILAASPTAQKKDRFGRQVPKLASSQISKVRAREYLTSTHLVCAAARYPSPRACVCALDLGGTRGDTHTHADAKNHL